MEQFIRFLNMLEEKSIYYRLNKVRPMGVMVEIAIPGERWEVEFQDDGSIDIEKFKGDGETFTCTDLNQCEEIDKLIEECSD